MARRTNNHWLDNIINYAHFSVQSTRRTTTVRNNPPIVVGNGILDQINTPPAYLEHLDILNISHGFDVLEL